MKNVEGKYETALVYTDNVDEASLAQVNTLCNMPYAEDSVEIIKHIRSIYNFQTF